MIKKLLFLFFVGFLYPSLSFSEVVCLQSEAVTSSIQVNSYSYSSLGMFSTSAATTAAVNSSKSGKTFYTTNQSSSRTVTGCVIGVIGYVWGTCSTAACMTNFTYGYYYSNPADPDCVSCVPPPCETVDTDRDGIPDSIDFDPSSATPVSFCKLADFEKDGITVARQVLLPDGRVVTYGNRDGAIAYLEINPEWQKQAFIQEGFPQDPCKPATNTSLEPGDPGYPAAAVSLAPPAPDLPFADDLDKVPGAEDTVFDGEETTPGNASSTLETSVAQINDNLGIVNNNIGGLGDILANVKDLNTVNNANAQATREAMGDLSAGVAVLGGKIDDLGTGLGGKIDDLGTGLGDKIDGLGTGLGDKIDGVKGSLDDAAAEKKADEEAAADYLDDAGQPGVIDGEKLGVVIDQFVADIDKPGLTGFLKSSGFQFSGSTPILTITNVFSGGPPAIVDFSEWESTIDLIGAGLLSVVSMMMGLYLFRG